MAIFISSVESINWKNSGYNFLVVEAESRLAVAEMINGKAFTCLGIKKWDGVQTVEDGLKVLVRQMVQTIQAVSIQKGLELNYSGWIMWAVNRLYRDKEVAFIIEGQNRDLARRTLTNNAYWMYLDSSPCFIDCAPPLEASVVCQVLGTQNQMWMLEGRNPTDKYLM